MSRDQVLHLLHLALPELRKAYGVKELSLFGSVARDEASPGSDVDILAAFSVPLTLTAYMGLKADLENRLGAAVDLVTPGAIKPRLLASIEGDLLRVS